MRIIFEEELNDNWREMSFEIFRVFDGEDLVLGRKVLVLDFEVVFGEWELLRLDFSKKELFSLCLDKESDKDFGF